MLPERPNPQEIYQVISERVLKIPDLNTYIRESIIPRMNERRGRNENLTGSEVTEKLIAGKDPAGQVRVLFNELYRGFPIPEEGSVITTELLELFQALYGGKEFDRKKLTPEIAHEVADIIYYTSQPELTEWLWDPTQFFETLGIGMETARLLCIYKYEVRLGFPAGVKDKDVEFAVLGSFLKDRNILNAPLSSIELHDTLL